MPFDFCFQVIRTIRNGVLMPHESDQSKSRIIWVDLARAVAIGKHVMARNSRLTALDSLRGFGILLVVLGHTSRSAGLVSWIFSFHMPLFFIISGMLFHERQFLDSFKKKVARLLIPYLFFGIVTFAYWALIERRLRGGQWFRHECVDEHFSRPCRNQ